MNLLVLAFLVGMAVTLLVVGAGLFVLDLVTTVPLAEPTKLARASTWVTASAALPVLVLLAGGL